MGQCQYCRRDSNSDPLDLSPDKVRNAGMNGHRREVMGHAGSDSALDSGHSCCDEGSYLDEARGSHSSESSGKYSLRESLASCGDCERRALCVEQGKQHSAIELQELSEDEDGREVRSACEDNLRPLHFVFPVRKVSRGSTSSDRGSISSVSSITAALQERLGRSTSLKIRRPKAESELPNQESSGLVAPQHPRRAVSLRISRSHRKRHEADTNLPTIYVEESPRSRSHQEPEPQRKSSLRRALSLLSINSLRQNTPSQQQKPQKPVQRILRQPRRRHNTVRGLSGMAIDAANQPMALQRSSTVYYPTAATLRHTYATRRTYSDNQT